MRKQKISLTESELHRLIKRSVNHVLKEEFNREAFYDAIDYINSGLGFRAWRRRYEDIEPLEAENIFNDAESYCRMMRHNDEKFNVRPNRDGRYPGENMNVIDRNGIEGLRALGGGGSRFRSIQALRSGGMDMDSAFKEYDRLSKI